MKFRLRITALFTALALTLLSAQSQTMSEPGPRIYSPGSVFNSDSTKKDSVKTDINYRVVKKELNYATQLQVGTGIMVFIILTMSLMNNFNPDRK